MDERYADVLLGGLYAIGAAVGLGIFGEVELLGVMLTDTFTTLSGYDVLYHHLLSIIGLAGAYAINQPSWGALSDVKRGLIGLALGTLVVSVLSPDTIDSIITQDALALVVFGLQAGGYWGIAHS